MRLAGIALVAACAALPRARDVADLEQILADELPALMEEHRVPGVAVAVADGGALAWSAGYGVADARTEAPVDPGGTRFQAASISKTTAGWAALLAVQEGRVDLDAPVQDVLTSWALPPSEHDPRGVNLRRLLTHTAGLDVPGYDGWASAPPPSLVDSLSGTVDPATAVRLVDEPGRRARYSGGGLSVAQQALEDATGETLDAWLSARLFAPAGLASATFDPAAFDGEDVAAPHDREGAAQPMRYYAEHAAAGLLITAEDLLAYGLLLHDPQGLASAAEIELLAADREAPGRFGLAWQVDRHRGVALAGHDGANVGGYRTLLQVAPASGHALVVLTNGEGGEAIHAAIEHAWRGVLSQGEGSGR